MAAQNDWIVANLNNPGFTNEDMQDVLGMNMDNTQLLDKDYYESKKFITEHPAFQDSEGNFSKEKFESFYDSTLSRWGEFGENHQLDNFEYSMFDPRADANSRIKNPNFRFETVMNPDRLTIGIRGWNETGERKWTPSELAQTQKIWDSKTNTYLDETPNDSALFVNPLKFVKNLFADPIMLATWDEDGEHVDPASGQTVKHKKGQYKLNDEGTYFTEKVNDRSTVGKQVISAFDLITVDNSEINKYDFFDSDSLDKSVTGTIMKNVAAVAPLFIGGPTAAIYSGILIARELCKSLPMLYGMSTALFGNENDVDILNTLAAYGQKYTGGTSEYGKTHTFSFEQIGNLMSDVATQWGQQKLISQAFNKLRGGEKALKHADDLAYAEYDSQKAKLINDIKLGKADPNSLLEYTMSPDNNWRNSLFGRTALNKYLPAAQEQMKRNARLGADAALAYMAVVSNYDVYNTMLEYGTTKKEASLVAWGSTLGMFSVDRFLGLGEMFFDDLQDQNKNALRKYAREKAQEYGKSINLANDMAESIYDPSKGFRQRTLARISEINQQDASKLRKGILIGKAIGNEISNSINNYKTGVANHTLGALGKAFGEGLEEATEELVTDTTKQLYEWTGQLGFDTTTDDVGAWDNAFDRYAMSFLGGMAGGAMFYGVGKFQEAKQESKAQKQKLPEDEIIYLLRNHKKGEIFKELDTLHKKGKLGSTKYGIISEIDENHNRNFLTAKEGEKTQNDVIYDMIKNGINQMDGYINEYGANLSEDELFKQMVLGDERLMAIKQKIGDNSYTTGYQNAFQTALKEVVNTRFNIDNESLNLTDAQRRKKELTEEKDIKENDEKIKNSQKAIDTNTKKLQESEAKLNEFLTGANSMDYARKLVFLSDPIIQSGWTCNTFDQWLYKNKDGRTIDSLSRAEKELFQNEYLNYINTSKKLEDDLAWDSFKNMEKDFTPYLKNLEENQDVVKQLHDTFKEINNIRENIKNIRTEGELTYDDKIPNESDEDFNHRNDYLNETLTPEERENAIQKADERKKLINDYNAEYRANRNKLVETVQKLTNLIEQKGQIDPTIYRDLKSTVRAFTKKEFYKDAIVNSIYDIGENVETARLNQDFLNDVFKLLKGTTLASMKILKDSYNLRANRIKVSLDNYNKMVEYVVNNNYSDLIKYIFNNKLHQSDELLDGILDEAYDIQPTQTDKIQEIINKLESSPELIEKLKNKIKERVATNETNVKQFFDDSLSHELITNVFDNYKSAIESSTNYDDLFNKLEDVDNNTQTFGKADTDIKSSLNTIINYINQKAIEQLGVLVTDSEEELKSNLSLISSINLDIIKKLNSEVRNKINTSTDLSSASGIETSVSEFKNNITNNLFNKISQSPFIKFFDTIDKKLTAKSPIADIAKIAAEKYGIAESDIDTVLSKIESTFDENSDIEDFTLQPQEEQTLQYLNKLFDLFNIYLYQSSQEPTWLSPFGHAKFWNDFHSKNKELFQNDFHLPQLESGIAHQFINELCNYQREIQFWLKLHENNTMNKERQFNTAEQKLEETKLQFYKNNIKAFQNAITINKITCGDLLDSISDTDTVLDIETKLANNLYNILSQGISLKQYLKETQLFEKILGEGGLNNIGNQKTTVLDDKLSYSELTDYQKLQFLVSALLFNSSKFKQENKKFLENQNGTKIAPLSIQEEIIHSIKGFINSNYAKQQTNEYLKESYPELSKKYPILTNTLIVEGVGGAGKTKAVIKRGVENLTSEEIWQSAPSEKALNGLDESIGKNANKFSYQDLMKQIILDENEYKTEKNNCKKKELHTTKGTYIESGNIKLKSTDGKVKAVIIDEASYYDYFDLQLIDRWARENNISVILSGDNFQMGNRDYGNSLNREKLFTLFRTPRLNISLRESNVHVMNNNASIDKAMTQIEELYSNSNLDTDERENLFTNNVKDILNQIKLTYFYDDSAFNGTIQVKEIPDEILNVLKNSNSIAYIGNNETSPIFKKLTELGIKFDNTNNYVFKNIKDIQGSEFDYVIYDDLFELTNDEKSQYFGEDAYNIGRKFTTLNGRAKEGVVIIEKDFDSEIEASIERKSTTSKGKTIQNAVDNFIKSSLEKLNKLNLTGEYHDLSELKAPETNVDPINTESTEITSNPEDNTGDVNPEEQKNIEDSTRESLIQESEQLKQEEFDRNPKEEDPIVTPDQIESIGYFLPVMGEFHRNEKGEIESSQPLEINGKRIVRDLGIVTYNQNNVNLNDREEIDNYVNQYEHIIKVISTLLVNPHKYDNYSSSVFTDYISSKRLLSIFKGECNDKLSDGRKWGIYLEAHDLTPEDEAIGLGFNKVTTINGKVYKYVLRFGSNSDINTEFALTLALAANPETWKKKLNSIENQEERENLANQISNYENFLQTIDESGVQITSDGAYTKLRQLTETLDNGNVVRTHKQLGTILVRNSNGNVVEYKKGWGDMGHGKYVSKSQMLIMGKDISKLGIKASNSGKLGMFVSEFDYNPNDLYRIYKEEKETGSGCTVRLMMLDNAGLNWDNLNNTLYKNFYKKDDQFSVINGEANGYRFLTSLWNWRADLENFKNIYEQEFDNISDEDVTNAIRAIDETYEKNKGVMPDSFDESIIKSNNTTKELVQKVLDFNNKLDSENYHTFRLGASKRGRNVQEIYPKNKDVYFGKAKQTEHVYGLAVTPKIAKLYHQYITGIFNLFTKTNDSRINLSIHYNDGDELFKITDRIDGDRLGSLKKNKESYEERATGNSFTNFLDDRATTVTSIEIQNPDGGTTNINFDQTGTAFAQFYYAVSHLYNLAKIACWNQYDPEYTNYGTIKIKLGKKQNEKSEEIDDVAEIDRTELNNFINFVKTSPEDYDIMDEVFKATNNIDDVDTSKWRFEFGDMFDYMLHGTKFDVSNNRYDQFRITGAMYPHGIFVDPTRTQSFVKDDETGVTIYYTNLHERFAVTDCDTDLVWKFKYKKLSITETVTTTTQTATQNVGELYYQLSVKDPSNFSGNVIINNDTNEEIAKINISPSTKSCEINGNLYHVIRTNDSIIIYDNNYVSLDEDILNKMKNEVVLDDENVINQNLYTFLNSNIQNANGYIISLKEGSDSNYFISDVTTNQKLGELLVDNNGITKFIPAQVDTNITQNNIRLVIQDCISNNLGNDEIYERMFEFYKDRYKNVNSFEEFDDAAFDDTNIFITQDMVKEYMNEINKLIESCNIK